MVSLLNCFENNLNVLESDLSKCWTSHESEKLRAGDSTVLKKVRLKCDEGS